jgi:hypothetical protein
MSSAITLGFSAVDPPTANAGREIRPLTPDEVKSALAGEIQAAIGSLHQGNPDRLVRSLRYYHGEPFGNEMPGRSSVVLTDVAETIEWILPSLMRMFLGGNLVVEYRATHPDHEQGAREATEWVNHDFVENQGGLRLFYEWFKDALMQQNGFVCLFAEEVVEPRTETYHGLTEQAILLLMLNHELMPVAYTEREYGGEVLYDISVQKQMRDCRIVAEGVPPEEMMVAARAAKLDDRIPFIGRRRRVTRSDLIAMGYPIDVVLGLPADMAGLNRTVDRDIRTRSVSPIALDQVKRSDAASDELWLNDCYMRIDEDGDGYAELRHFISVGEASQTILEDEEVNRQPFVTITPTPMPHSFFGISVTDQIADLQVIRSTLLRQMLDNAYLTNSPRIGVVEGEVQIDDLMTSRPGGIVRMNAPGMVEPIAVGALSPGVFNLMQWLEEVKESRIGASRWTQGLDAQALKSTATGITSMLSAAQSRIELIARLFADGVRQFFRLYLQALIESPIKARAMKVSGAWKTLDPKEWSADMAVHVEVGLGTGQAAERMAFLQTVMQMQAAIAQSGLTHVVTPDNVYAAASKMSEAMGFRQRGMFFTDPNGEPPPPPAPDPRVYESDRRAKDNAADRELKALELQKGMADAVNDNEFARLELREKMRIERERIASQERIALRKIELDAEVARRAATEKKEAKNARKDPA